ncbi:MAG: hypothetical protein KAJ03_03495 [Gammaproteobacteria bacterium]|nr:hypothetical protein [Gammaproteobacteria bacterium]
MDIVIAPPRILTDEEIEQTVHRYKSIGLHVGMITRDLRHGTVFTDVVDVHGHEPVPEMCQLDINYNVPVTPSQCDEIINTNIVKLNISFEMPSHGTVKLKSVDAVR